jgi:predicted nucleic acid-binding Zn ribbon protein
MSLEDAILAGLKHVAKRMQPTIKDPERKCVICGHDYYAVAPLQKTCSLPCRKILWEKNGHVFKERNPRKMQVYNATRLLKDPDTWSRKFKEERLVILQALGGKCIACDATNPNWLHVDYVPTMAGTGMRHPRHKKWVLDHISDFRILCANHHYELTITGKIEGTNIIQQKRSKK